MSKGVPVPLFRVVFARHQRFVLSSSESPTPLDLGVNESVPPEIG